MPKVTRVGLDIGSSAVRAAEVVAGDGTSEVRRFAQVGLPPGAVVEGEVRDQEAVSGAISRLWAEGGFTKKDVVVGIGSQRAMVRQLEMPVMAGGELRTALRYEIGELLPIPIEQAIYDFAMIGPGRPKDDGAPTTQVLAVVAQKDIVWDVINTVRKAGLRPRAVDSAPLAMLRSVAPAPDGGLEALVSLGSHLAVVAVREGLFPRFVRTVTIGGEAVNSVNGEVSVGSNSSPSRFATRGSPETDSTSRAAGVVEEVRGSLEYFLSHGHGEQLSVVSLTGGGALDNEVAQRIGASVGVPVQRARVAAAYDPASLGLSEDQLHEAEMLWVTAIGLALWGLNGASAPSLLPIEIKERFRRNQVIMGAGVGITVIAAALGVFSHGRSDEITSTKQEVSAQQTQVDNLSARMADLHKQVLPAQEVKSLDQIAAGALANDVNWLKLYGDIKASLPAGTYITEISFSNSAEAATTPTTTSATATVQGPAVVGSVTVSATSNAGPPAVGRFLQRAYNVKGLASIWVSSVTQAGASWTFQMTANITSQALSNRTSTLPGATQP